jgi:MFS superfamily sulfate permease-like transporter
MFLSTLLITFFSTVTTGILLCLGLSALLIVRKTTTANFSVMGRLPPMGPTEPTFSHVHGHSTLEPTVSASSSDSHGQREPTKFVEITEHPDAELLEGVILLRVDTPLMFYNVGQARRSIEALMKVETKLLMRRREREMLRRQQSDLEVREENGNDPNGIGSFLSGEGSTGAIGEYIRNEIDSSETRTDMTRGSSDAGILGGRGDLEESSNGQVRTVTSRLWGKLRRLVEARQHQQNSSPNRQLGISGNSTGSVCLPKVTEGIHTIVFDFKNCLDMVG